MEVENPMVNERHWKYRERLQKLAAEEHLDESDHEAIHAISSMHIPYHIYECEECIVSFAVEMAFEDQGAVKCPICGNDESLRDIAAGEMTLREVVEE